MNAHKPGPWEVCDDHPDRACYHIRAKSRVWDFGDDVATIYSPGDAEADANARLIAAAPDLLAVLEEICRTWDVSNALHHVGEPSYLHRKARAAIAKATGGAA